MLTLVHQRVAKKTGDRLERLDNKQAENKQEDNKQPDNTQPDSQLNTCGVAPAFKSMPPKSILPENLHQTPQCCNQLTKLVYFHDNAPIVAMEIGGQGDTQMETA